ncbi:MAG: hypothetical protein HC896_00925, partial [Bacteroidales bacterium]|nr:hypothetical protein [Bacteroidales bacterium]
MIYTVVLGCICATAVASGQDKHFNKFSLEDGLPSNYINAVATDSLGFIWIGTEKGIVRYNGYEFQSLASGNDSLDKARLVSANVLDIAIDHNNCVWFGTWTGLAKYDQAANTYTVYTEDTVNNHHQILNNYCRAVEIDKNNNVWVGNWYGLTIIRQQANQIQNIKLPAITGDIFSGCVVSLLPDENEKEVWLGTWSGYIYRYNLPNNEFTRVKSEQNELGSPINGFVADLYRHPNGQLYACTWAQGLCTINEQALTISQSPARLNTVRAHKALSVNHQLYVGTENGLNVVSTNGSSFYLPDANIEGGLSSKVILDFTTDKQGGLWMATIAGANYYHPLYTKFQKITYNLYKETSLPSNTVASVFEYPKGINWFSTDKGLYIVDLKSKKTYTPRELGVNMDPQTLVHSFCSSTTKPWSLAPQPLYWCTIWP